ARAGDFEALLRVLDPDVVVRADAGVLRTARSGEVRGAHAAAEQALSFRALAGGARPALVNGTAGLVVFAGDRPFGVIGFTVRKGRISEIDILADPDRLREMDFTILDG